MNQPSMNQPSSPTEPLKINGAQFNRRLWIDVGVRIVLGLFFAFSAGVYGQNALGELKRLSLSGFNLATFSNGLAIFAVSLYSLTIACLYVVRYQPTNKFAGWWPCAAALLGGFMGMGLILFKPSAHLPVAVQLTGSLMVLTGNGLTAFILTRLGRSFSILPESRKLVVSGPYKYIRHPLYLVEAIATTGALINFWCLGAVALVFTQFLFQFVRMHYEEKVLCSQFPEYEEYAKKTARLIPGLY